MSQGGYGDYDDLAYGGPARPAGAEVTDPTPRWGRLTPLPLKMDGYFAGPPLGFTQTGNAAAAQSTVPPPGAMSATVQVQGGAIRYTFDGTTPTAAVGHRADAGTILQLTMDETIRGFQWINEGATATTLAVTFWA